MPWRTYATKWVKRFFDEDPEASKSRTRLDYRSGRRQITRDVRFSAGIFNLTDKRWSSRANVINRPPTISRFLGWPSRARTFGRL